MSSHAKTQELLNPDPGPMSEAACRRCRFYRAPQSHQEGQCRRSAPTAYDFIRYHHLEILRYAALALGRIARFDDNQIPAQLTDEATEALSDAAWPQVQPDEWCGSFEEKPAEEKPAEEKPAEEKPA